ncbi:MAG: hypothetical protein HZA54_10705, partial [Planctomycetes bacterium]|nr:hypothetical protein [Planctomycetota bacterium]
LAAWRRAPPDPVAGATAYALSFVHLRLQKHEGVCEDLDRAIDSDPRNAVYYNARGDAHRKNGRFLETCRDKGEAIRLDSTRDLELFSFLISTKTRQPAMLMVIGSAMVDLGRRSPDDASAQYVEGVRHVLVHDAGAACARLARAVELDPKFAAAHRLRALAELRAGRRAEAEQALARAGELAGEGPLFLLIRAALRASGKDLEGGGRDLAAAARLGGIPEATVDEFAELAPLARDPRYRALRGER